MIDGRNRAGLVEAGHIFGGGAMVDAGAGWRCHYSAIMVDGHLPNLVVAVAFSFRRCAVRLPCLRWL